MLTEWYCASLCVGMCMHVHFCVCVCEKNTSQADPLNILHSLKGAEACTLLIPTQA